jgi:hypothetical protein
MKFILTSIILFSFSAIAHFQIGTYKGSDGVNSCEVEFLSVDFVNGVKNPLNEMVHVKFENENYVLRHLMNFNDENNHINFNKNQLTGYFGTTTGANFLEIYMDQEGISEGPSSFKKVFNNWKTGEVRVSECKNLEFISK